MLGKLIKKAPVNNVLMTRFELKLYFDCLLLMTSMPRPDLKRAFLAEKYYNLTSIKKIGIYRSTNTRAPGHRSVLVPR